MRISKLIRIFPRRTKWTPVDEFAIVGDPGLFRPPIQPVKISCTFTWDIPECERLYRAWSTYYPDVELGDPAFDDPGGDFEPGLFIKNGVTCTSRGCNKECKYCFVPRREGSIREIEIKDGWDVIDNNLLACSEQHLLKVFEMLKRQPEPIKFSGGFDSELLTEKHVELLKTIRLKYVWFACDYPGAFEKLEMVADLMSDFSQFKKRCYVLIGFENESIKQAEKRLKSVFKLGFDPMAMLYRGEDKVEYSQDWKNLRRYWSLPAIFRNAEKKKDI